MKVSHIYCLRFQNNNNDTLFIQLDNIALLFTMHNCKNTELPPEMQIPYKIMFLTTHLIKINNHGLCNTNIYQIENLKRVIMLECNELVDKALKM